MLAAQTSRRCRQEMEPPSMSGRETVTQGSGLVESGAEWLTIHDPRRVEAKGPAARRHASVKRWLDLTGGVRSGGRADTARPEAPQPLPRNPAASSRLMLISGRRYSGRGSVIKEKVSVITKMPILAMFCRMGT